MNIFRHHEPKFWFTVTNKLTCEFHVMRLTEKQADKYRNRGYWVE